MSVLNEWPAVLRRRADERLVALCVATFLVIAGQGALSLVTGRFGRQVVLGHETSIAAALVAAGVLVAAAGVAVTITRRDHPTAGPLTIGAGRS